MITGEITKGLDLPLRLTKTLPLINNAVQGTVVRLAIKMSALVQRKLSGEVLKVRTGRLRRSINIKYDNKGASFDAIIGTNVKYGAVHELGLTIPPHIVEAKNAKALKFISSGKTVFAKRVNIPAVQMPERSFLRTALNEMESEIATQLTAAVMKEFKGK